MLLNIKKEEGKSDSHIVRHNKKFDFKRLWASFRRSVEATKAFGGNKQRINVYEKK